MKTNKATRIRYYQNENPTDEGAIDRRVWIISIPSSQMGPLRASLRTKGIELKTISKARLHKLPAGWKPVVIDQHFSHARHPAKYSLGKDNSYPPQSPECGAANKIDGTGCDNPVCGWKPNFNFSL